MASAARGQATGAVLEFRTQGAFDVLLWAMAPGRGRSESRSGERRHTMLSPEENALITQTGPGTPGGELLRRYWQPAALSEELPPGGPPVAIRLLSEDLVLYRDESGRPG